MYKRRRRQHSHPQAPLRPTDDDIVFNFQIAKALGCVAITTERNDALARKLPPFAESTKSRGLP